MERSKEQRITAGQLQKKLPTLETLLALDDDECTGRRRWPLNNFTIREVCALRELLDSFHEDTLITEHLVDMQPATENTTELEENVSARYVVELTVKKKDEQRLLYIDGGVIETAINETLNEDKNWRGAPKIDILVYNG